MWKEGILDLTQPQTFAEYFSRLYRLCEHDTRGVMAAEREHRFEDVAKLFRMIEQAGDPVVALYGEWQELVADVRRWGISRLKMRRLQPLMVNLYPQEIETLRAAGAVERIEDSFWCTVPGFRIYSERWGFGWQGRLLAEPEDLIA